MLSSADTQRIASVLAQFGCNRRETGIYTESLTLGPAPVQQLARRLGQNRVTVHSAVEQLIALGMMYETRKGRRRLVGAEEPDVLYRLLRRKRTELELTEKNLDFVADKLKALVDRKGGVPSVKLYEGTEGLKHMLEETLSAKGEVLVFTYVDLFSRLLTPAYLESYYRRRAAKGISTRLIFPSEEFGRKVAARAAQYRMQVRFLPPGLQWKSGIFSWNDIVAIQSFTEGRVTCTIIENEDIAHFYRSIMFEMCWNQASAS